MGLMLALKNAQSRVGICGRIPHQLLDVSPTLTVRHYENLQLMKVRQMSTKEQSEDKPIKFTSSDAHLNYKAVRNFYGDDRELPDSHNKVLVITFISTIFYFMFIRDDIDDNQGVADLFKPVHETIPALAIPMIQSAIMENRKFGLSTKKLEEKLAEYMKEPEKYGGLPPKPRKSWYERIFGQ